MGREVGGGCGGAKFVAAAMLCFSLVRVLITILMYTLARWTDATDMENEITAPRVCMLVWDASDIHCHLASSYLSFHLYLRPVVVFVLFSRASVLFYFVLFFS